MEATLALVDRLRAAGIAAVVSGAGPAVLALTSGAGGVPEGTAPEGWQVLRPRLDAGGAMLRLV
jgi:homoserine kinase